MKDVNGKIQYKDHEYTAVFNLNVMEVLQEEYGSVTAWAELTSGEEPSAKAVIFGFTEMLNEGIDIENEDNGTDIKHLTQKQVGRMLTEVGLQRMTQLMQDTVIESTKSAEKN